MSRAAERYDLADHQFRESDPYAIGKYRVTARWLRSLPTRGVLYNIGCGSGEFNEMAVQLGFIVEAFEPDAATFALAVGRRPTTRCQVRPLPLGAIPGQSVADVVVMHDVLEHIEDDPDAVAQVARILKPGGVLVVTVPALPALYGFHDEQLKHFRRYTRRSVRGLLGPIFDVDRIRYYGATLIPITWWFSRFRRRPYPTSTVASGGLMAGVLAGVCRVEGRMRAPIGTSLVAMCRRKP
jgi:SAM-dependent methyltransferase